MFFPQVLLSFVPFLWKTLCFILQKTYGIARGVRADHKHLLIIEQHFAWAAAHTMTALLVLVSAAKALLRVWPLGLGCNAKHTSAFEIGWHEERCWKTQRTLN